MGCVYVATNKVNGKQYVGKTIYSLEHRRYFHERSANSSSKYLFPRALGKHGINSFEWEIAFESHNERELLAKEIELIEQLGTFGLGYNMTKGGDGVSGVLSAMKGKQHTIETRKKISDKLKGNKLWLGKHHTDETKIKISIAGIGRHHTDEAKSKIAVGLSGIKRSDETKKRVSESIKEWHRRRRENKP